MHGLKKDCWIYKLAFTIYDHQDHIEDETNVQADIFVDNNVFAGYG